jgi:hypothetical protein
MIRVNLMDAKTAGYLGSEMGSPFRQSNQVALR